MWPFRQRREERDLFNIGGVLPLPGTRSGVNVTPDTSLRLSAVWACRRLLADTISTLPVDAFRQGSREPVTPKPSLLVTPAAYCTFADWTYQTIQCVLGYGNVYGRITARTGAAERPSQIELLAPERVRIDYASDRYTVVVRLDGQEIDRDEIWHFRGYSCPGMLTGMSPIAYARESIGLGLAAQSFGADFFGGGGVPTGILSHQAKKLDAKEAKEISDRWNVARRGRGTAVFGPEWKYQSVSISPEESQFLETQKFSLQQIA